MMSGANFAVLFTIYNVLVFSCIVKVPGEKTSATVVLSLWMFKATFNNISCIPLYSGNI